MTGAPVFSLLVAAYNSEATIAETLDSLLAQTDPRWEAIVIDDGSRDRTGEIAASYAARDSRIRVIREGDVGAGRSRNSAAAIAGGMWLCALDADDLLVQEALEHQARFMEEHPGFELYSWGSWRQWPDGSRTPFDDSEEYRSVVSFDLEAMLDHNRILVNSLIRADAFAQAGGFRDYFAADYDLWLRVLHAGARHLHNPELLAVYRMREGSMSTNAPVNMMGTVTVLEDFAKTPNLDPRHKAMALERAEYWRAWSARMQLDASLAEGDYARVRELLPTSRPTFGGGARTAFGLALLRIAPSAYVAYKRLRAGDSASEEAGR